MSDTAVATPVAVTVPSFEVFLTAASAACPWYGTASKAELPLLYADYQTAAANGVVLADYLVDQATGWESAAAYLADAGVSVPEPEETAPKQWAKFETAADAYASKTGAAALDVGKAAQKYITAVLKGKTDAGLVRELRAAAVKRIDGYLLDVSADTLNSGKAMRLWGVACVFGESDARKLGIGKLRAFESCLYREKDGAELWSFKDDVTEDQQSKVKAYWQCVVKGDVKDGAAVVAAQVAALLGKAPKATTTVVAEPTAPDAVEEDEVDVEPTMAQLMNDSPTPKTGSNPAPMVQPEKPGDVAVAMNALVYGRPDALAALRMFGQSHHWTAEEATALIMGMIEGGHLQAVNAAVLAAVNESKRLASAASAQTAAA